MRILLILLLLGLPASTVSGQTILSRPYETNQLTVEALIPDTPQNTGLWSGGLFLTGTLSVSENVEIGAELPVARYAAANGGTGTATAVGNPYVGLGFSSTRIPIFFQVGARLPTAPENAATTIGRQVDIGRLRAFRHEEFALTGLLNGRLPLAQSTSLRLRSGLTYASYPSPRAGVDGRDRDWRMRYEAQIWHEGDRLITGFTFAGQAVLTHPGGTRHHGVISIMGNWNRIQPGVVAGTSLTDLIRRGDFFPFVGLTLSVNYHR